MAEEDQVDLVLTWQQTVKQDIGRGGVSWEQVPLLAVDRVAWKELTAYVPNALQELSPK